MKLREQKIPTWDKCNISKPYGRDITDSIDVVEENNRIKDFLERHGYSFRDSCNIFENGYTLTFEKYVGEKRILFDFHWRNECCNVYWWGSLRGSFKYFPNETLLCPVGFFELDSITERFMKDDLFKKMEENLINLLKSQEVILK